MSSSGFVPCNSTFDARVVPNEEHAHVWREIFTAASVSHTGVKVKTQVSEGVSVLHYPHIVVPLARDHSSGLSYLPCIHSLSKSLFSIKPYVLSGIFTAVLSANRIRACDLIHDAILRLRYTVDTACFTV